MHATFMWTALAVAPIILQPVLAVLPKWTLPDCKPELKYDTLEDPGGFWGATLAEKYADEYIKQNVDHSNWTQDLYMELFPQYDHTNMACVDFDSICELGPASCADFNKLKLGGLYYLFVSLKNFHSYMKGLHGRFQDEAFLSSLSLSGMKTELKIPDGTKDAEPVDQWALLAGGFSIGAAGLGVLNPAAGAAVAAVSGVFQVISTLTSAKKEQLIFNDFTDDDTKKLLDNLTEGVYESINTIIAAVFGKQNHLQSDIPASMVVGNTANPAVGVFGYGAWLRDQPNIQLDDMFEEGTHRFTQALVWDMARRYKGAVVIIRDDMKENDCNGINNAWDGNRCLDILIWNQKGINDDHRYFGGAHDIEGIWAKYGMNPLATMKNSVDCWVSSGGNMGDTKPNPNSGDLPPCFFPQVVKKGFWHQQKHGYIDQDGSWPGQEGQNGQKWP